jgi:hypothetical protein
MTMRGSDGAIAAGGLRDLLSAGVQRSTGWMHVIAVFFAFTSDFVKPILPYLTGLLVGITFGVFLLIWFLVRFRRLRSETLAAAAIFFLVTAALSVAVLGIQRIEGNPEEGATAHAFSEVRQLQRSLDIVGQRTVRIEADTKQILGLLNKKQPPHTATILQHIAGNWGEGDCSAVSYRFSRVENALVIESVKRPSGAPPYGFVGTIVSEGDASIEVRGEKPESAKGLAATFQYESNGVTERLRWQDHVAGGTDVELNRCD